MILGTILNWDKPNEDLDIILPITVAPDTDHEVIIIKFKKLEINDKFHINQLDFAISVEKEKEFIEFISTTTKDFSKLLFIMKSIGTGNQLYKNNKIFLSDFYDEIKSKLKYYNPKYSFKETNYKINHTGEEMQEKIKDDSILIVPTMVTDQ